MRLKNPVGILPLAGALALCSAACGSDDEAPSTSATGGGGAVAGQAAGGAGAGGASAGGASSGGTGGASGSGTGGLGGTGTSGAGGVGGSGGCSGTPLPTQCTGGTPSTDLALCFENASGCPGETVEVPIYVNAPAGCSELEQATGGFDSQGWVLSNPAAQDVPTDGRCIRREECDMCTPPTWDWALLPGLAVGVAACPDTYPLSAGTPIDVLQIEIPLGTAPGDYTATAAQGSLFTLQAACGTPGPSGYVESTEVTAPTIRVY